MASLYDEGWRQGSIVEVEFPLDTFVLGSSGQPERSSAPHHLWAVATQDCDLDRAQIDDVAPGIELRPLFTADCPSEWGIRARKLRLTDSEYVEANSPRITVAPNVLTAVHTSGAARRDISFSRRLAFKTWLGLRYDRPAVPTHLVPLAQHIAKEVAGAKHREIGARVRDVLMQFDDSEDDIRYSLIAVLEDPGDRDAVRAWLARVAKEIPADLGVADQIEAASSDGIAFSTIETSYSADVSQVTWRRNQSGPEGAV